MPHQNIVFHSLLKQIPWATFDRLVDGHDADWDDRAIKSRAHLIAMLYGQLCGARGLREIEASLKSHAGKLYHLGGCTISKSALSSANASRPVEVFAGLLSALIAQLQNGYRRKIGDCVRLIDSTGAETAPQDIQAIAKPNVLERTYYPYNTVFHMLPPLFHPSITYRSIGRFDDPFGVDGGVERIAP